MQPGGIKCFQDGPAPGLGRDAPSVNRRGPREIGARDPHALQPSGDGRNVASLRSLVDAPRVSVLILHEFARGRCTERAGTTSFFLGRVLLSSRIQRNPPLSLRMANVDNRAGLSSPPHPA